MGLAQIGLVIAGCKGGYRLLCSNGIVDTQSDEVSRTLSDIRSVIRFRGNHLTLYALEFTSHHKVYSVYRSCNDTGSGAFVNIIVYVPHEIRIPKVREMLDRMIDQYFKEYVNPIHGTYYPGTYDNIAPFADILKNAGQEEESVLFTYRRSSQNEDTRFYIYKDVAEVDSFFDSPYRKEFFNCQEVMFMAKEMYEREEDLFNFNKTPQIITHVSEPERMPMLCVDVPEVTRLKINGQERDKKSSYPVNISTDHVEITVNYKFCNETVVSGLLSDVLEKRELKLVAETKQITVGDIPRRYANFSVPFSVNGQRTPDGLMQIRSNDGMSHDVSGSQVLISGERLDSEWSIYIQPLAFSKNEMLRAGKFRPSDYLNKIFDVKLQTFMFDVNMTGNVKECVFANISGIKPINLGMLRNNARVSLYLPQDAHVSTIEFDTESPEVEWSFDKTAKILLLKSKVLEYGFKIPDNLKDHILRWDFTIEGESRKRKKFNQEEIVKIGITENIQSGVLKINDKPCLFEVADYCVIPHLVFIEASGNVEYTYTVRNTEGKKVSSTAIGTTVLPYGAEFSVTAAGYTAVKTKEVDGTVFYELQQKQKKAADGKLPDKDKKNPIVKFVGCKGLYYSEAQGGPRKLIDKDSLSLEVKGAGVWLYDKAQIGKGHTLWSLFKGKPKSENKNINSIKSGNSYTVEYKRGSIPISSIILAVVIGALIGVAAIFGWRYFESRPHKEKSRITVMTINVNLAETPDLGESISKITLPVKSKIASVSEMGDEITVFWNAKAAKGQYAALRERGVTVYIGNSTEQVELTQDIIEELASLEEALVEAPEFKPKSGTLTVTTSLQEEFNDCKTLEDWQELLVEKNNDLDDRAIQAILEAAHNPLSEVSVADTSALRDYLKTFAEFNKHAEYIAVSDKLAELKETAATDARNQEIQSQALQYRKQLQSKECTERLVNQYCEWWKANESNLKSALRRDYDWYANAKKAYKAFFAVAKANDMENVKDNWLQVFSDHQQKVIQAYCDPDSFELLSENGIHFNYSEQTLNSRLH